MLNFSKNMPTKVKVIGKNGLLLEADLSYGKRPRLVDIQEGLFTVEVFATACKKQRCLSVRIGTHSYNADPLMNIEETEKGNTWVFLRDGNRQGKGTIQLGAGLVIQEITGFDGSKLTVEIENCGFKKATRFVGPELLMAG